MTNPSSSTDSSSGTSATSYSEVDLARGTAGAPGTELRLPQDGAPLRRSVVPGGVRGITEPVPWLR